MLPPEAKRTEKTKKKRFSDEDRVPDVRVDQVDSGSMSALEKFR
ncbi:MAG TPA: hypothetical protein VFP49_07700 [Nitrososphaeraceae archaeon]|nr:hypothetical protein [Nitrososphaeraceae archaeon]